MPWAVPGAPKSATIRTTATIVVAAVGGSIPTGTDFRPADTGQGARPGADVLRDGPDAASASEAPFMGAPGCCRPVWGRLDSRPGRRLGAYPRLRARSGAWTDFAPSCPRSAR
jgi:hypothetical protein